MRTRGRIVLFSSLPLVGGHTTITLKLCEMFADGRPVHLIVKDMSGHGYSSEAAEELTRRGVTITRLPAYRSGLPFLRALWDILRTNQRPSVFLSIGMRHLSPLLALLLRPRRSYYYHITHELSPAVLSQIGLYRRFFSRVIFISPATLEIYRKHSSRPSGLEWAVQPTGLPTSHPAPRPSGPIRFGFLGRLSKEKGVRLLLDFAAHNSLPCEIHFAGRGECEEEIRTAGGRVIFHGSYSPEQRAEFFAKFFAHVDWLCVPSLDDREGVPTVILEALQFGVPALVTNTGGMRSFGMRDFGPAARDVVRPVEPAKIPIELARLTPPDEKNRRRCQEYYHEYFRDEVVRCRWLRILRTGQSRQETVSGFPSMKLLIVMPSGVFHGGAEECLLQLVRERGAANLETPVVFLEDGNLPELIRAQGVAVTVLNAGRFRNVPRYLGAVANLCRVIHREKPDAVLGWMTKGHLYGGVAAALCGTPAVYFQMGVPDGGRIEALARHIPAAGALGCSDFIAREQQRYVRHPVFGIPLAFDEQRTAKATTISLAEAKALYEFDPARPLVGMVGRLQHWKGMHVFVEAMAEVLKKYPECQIVIIGGKHDLEPGYPAFLDGVIEKKRLRDRIRMPGSRTDTTHWMQAMDIFVHASDTEPFGLVIVEAMSLGKAVIAAREGGPPEIIQPDINGQLTPFGDVPALSRAILRYLDDPAFARRCGEAARKRAQIFTIPKYVQQIRSAMEQLLA